MIIRLDAKDIKDLLNKQYQAILEELEIEDDHPVSELLDEHFQELHANIQFKSEEVADDYKIPESVRETEEAIQRAREEAVEDFKQQLAEHAEEIKAKREAGEIPPDATRVPKAKPVKAAEGDAAEGEEGLEEGHTAATTGESAEAAPDDTDDEAKDAPIKMSAKEAKKLIFGAKRSPYGKELQ